LILVCGKRDPTNEEWTAWCEFYAAAVERDGVRRLFVVSAGGGPNARQRKQVISAVLQRVGPVVEELATAACGNSPMVRIVTAAFGWLAGVPRMKSFRADERERALDFLNAPAAQRAEILAVARRLESEVAGAPSRLSGDDAQ
jgi:hypothetical protein